MQVIPAIDFSRGRLARLDAGEVVPITAFGGDPAAAASSFVSDGAEWIHAVDLDLAFSGTVEELGTFEALLSTGARVQASGGIRDAPTARLVLASGVDRVVVGSAALANLDPVGELVRAEGGRVAIGLEVQDGRLRPRGSSEASDLPGLDEVLRWLSAAGVARIVLTAVGSVGSLAGPDLELLGQFRAAGSVVVLAGGVASLADVASLAEMDDGPEAVIIGRALYEGGLSLAEARAAAGEPAGPDVSSL